MYVEREREREREREMAHKRDKEEDGIDTNAGPDEKRNRFNLQSIVRDVMNINNVWKIMEPMLRRVVSEEVERALENFNPGKLVARPGERHFDESDCRNLELRSQNKPGERHFDESCYKNLQLRFQNKLAIPIYTGTKVESEEGSAIRVVLQDATTGEPITSGDEASAQLDIVVLEGDDNGDNEWTQDEFENHRVKEREGKRPILTGDCMVTLLEGFGTIGELVFNDNSSWIRSRKFRLGLKVSKGCCEGIRIREAKTEAFAVRDHRGELYKKHYPPTLDDEVWRLEKIGKHGAYHKRLNMMKIITVRDFLRAYFREPLKLRDIFGTNMSTKIWDVIIDHANTCILDEKRLVFYSREENGLGVIFNSVLRPLGILSKGHFRNSDLLSEIDKVHMDMLVQTAYRNSNQILEFKGDISGNVQNSSSSSYYLGEANNLKSICVGTNLHREAVSSSSSTAFSDFSHVLGNDGHHRMLSETRNLDARTSYLASRQETNPPCISSSQNLMIGVDQFESESSSCIEDMTRLYSEEEESLNGKGSEGVSESDDIQLQLQKYFHAFNPDIGDHLTGSFLNSMHVEDAFSVRSFSPMCYYSSSGDTNHIEIPRKAFSGWVKLKAALRFQILLRKRTKPVRLQIEEVN